MRLMTEIAHALAGSAGSAEARDRQHEREIAQLRERLSELHKQTAHRWLAAREYAEALFTAKVNLPKQGVIP
jgi:flagellar motility protein MotE (MotC chaperone)